MPNSPHHTSADRLGRAYTERAAACVAMARFALMCGFDAGVGISDQEDWDIEWRVVLYVDTPNGQVSWHIAPTDQHLLEGLPQYPHKWDGTFRSRETDYAKWGLDVAAPEPEKVLTFEEAASTSLELEADRVPVGSVWKHLKTDTIYVVHHVALIESTLEPSVVYSKHPFFMQVEDAPVSWVRPASQFLDGRFVRTNFAGDME